MSDEPKKERTELNDLPAEEELSDDEQKQTKGGQVRSLLYETPPQLERTDVYDDLNGPDKPVVNVDPLRCPSDPQRKT